jgi:hypothetical protein
VAEVDADRNELEASLWQGEGRRRRHVDAIEAQCLACGSDEVVASENTSFYCTSGHSRAFFRCVGCKRAFQSDYVGEPCPFCRGTVRVRSVSAWQWAEDQVQHPAQRQWALSDLRLPASDLVDSDRRFVHGFELAASGGSRLPANAICDIDFAKDSITIPEMAGQRSVMRASMPLLKESVRYEDVVALQVTGTTTRRNAGVFGGGFGVVGAAEGMLAAAVINT